MKRFELEIGVYIDAEDIDAMWEKFRKSGLHDALNDLGDGYTEVVGCEQIVEELSVCENCGKACDPVIILLSHQSGNERMTMRVCKEECSPIED